MSVSSARERLYITCSCGVVQATYTYLGVRRYLMSIATSFRCNVHNVREDGASVLLLSFCAGNLYPRIVF